MSTGDDSEEAKTTSTADNTEDTSAESKTKTNGRKKKRKSIENIDSISSEPKQVKKVKTNKQDSENTTQKDEPDENLSNVEKKSSRPVVNAFVKRAQDKVNKYKKKSPSGSFVVTPMKSTDEKKRNNSKGVTNLFYFSVIVFILTLSLTVRNHSFYV